MAARRPDKRHLELKVALHAAEVLLHSFLDSPSSLLPPVLLGNPPGQPVERHRALSFDNALDHSPQRKCVDVVEEPCGICNDAFHRLTILLSRRRGTPVCVNHDLANRLVSVRQRALIAVSFRVNRARRAGTGLGVLHEAGPVQF